MCQCLIYNADRSTALLQYLTSLAKYYLTWLFVSNPCLDSKPFAIQWLLPQGAMAMGHWQVWDCWDHHECKWQSCHSPMNVEQLYIQWHMSKAKLHSMSLDRKAGVLRDKWGADTVWVPGTATMKLVNYSLLGIYIPSFNFYMNLNESCSWNESEIHPGQVCLWGTEALSAVFRRLAWDLLN